MDAIGRNQQRLMADAGVLFVAPRRVYGGRMVRQRDIST
jgi:hypothetical protein